MEYFYQMLPIVILTVAALVSELAGILAVFIEGTTNLGAFLCVLFSNLTGNIQAGCFLSINTCILFIFLISVFTLKTKSNPFLVGIAINLISEGIIPLLSSFAFNTKGSVSFVPNPSSSIISVFIVSWILVCTFIVMFYKSSWGLRVRLIGKNEQVLLSRGINIFHYKISVWCISALASAITGCLLALRIKAFVPNICAGNGWIALALVFLGQKKGMGVFIASIAFAIIQIIGNYLQISLNIPSSFLLVFPYVIVLLFFVFFPKEKD